MAAQPTETNGSEILDIVHPAPNAVKQLDATLQYVRARAREGKSAFVDRSMPAMYFERDLLYRPFYFATAPQFGVSRGKYPQPMARLGVYLMYSDGSLSEPVIAQFTNRYLYYDIKGLATEGGLYAPCYTLARDTTLPKTPQDNYPVRLKYYEGPEIDVPEDEGEDDDGESFSIPPGVMPSGLSQPKLTATARSQRVAPVVTDNTRDDTRNDTRDEFDVLTQRRNAANSAALDVIERAKPKRGPGRPLGSRNSAPRQFFPPQGE